MDRCLHFFFQLRWNMINLIIAVSSLLTLFSPLLLSSHCRVVHFKKHHPTGATPLSLLFLTSRLSFDIVTQLPPCSSLQEKPPKLSSIQLNCLNIFYSKVRDPSHPRSFTPVKLKVWPPSSLLMGIAVLLWAWQVSNAQSRPPFGWITLTICKLSPRTKAQG